MKDKAKIVKVFEALGFEVMDKAMPGLSTFGTMQAEKYDVGKDHFTPINRNVFFGETATGYYITSDIKGMMRLYRHKNEYETEIGNIFGHGKTVDEALDDFTYNFQNKIYNSKK